MTKLNEQLKNSMAYLNNKKYAIAVSGGSDSVALLLLCAQYCSKECVVVHFDHNVRKESANEALFVEKLSKKLGFSFEKKVWSNDEKSLETGNFYQSARLARYNFFKQVCKQYSLEGVLIAHSKTDLAETLLMRLGKGASIKGASIFKQGINIYGVKVFRPLLSFSRQDLKDYLTSINQEWKTDPSNKDENKLRPRVRSILAKLEEIGISLNGLKSSVEYFNQANDALNFYFQKELNNLYYNKKLNYFNINNIFFNNLPIEIKVRFLNYIIKSFNNGIIHLPRRKKLIELFSRINNTKIENIDCITIELKEDKIYFYLSDSKFNFDKNKTYLKDLAKQERYNYIKKHNLSNLPIKIRNRISI